jgi:ribosomal protein L40E
MKKKIKENLKNYTTAYCEICDEKMAANPKEAPICFKCLERNLK